MKVLVACEFSGIVRDAFRERGHVAVSVDLLPTERPGAHIIGDALRVLESDRWDLLIAHPPCTYLANSGVRWLYGGMGTTPDWERLDRMKEAADFFARFMTANVDRIAIENPVMHRHGREYIRLFANRGWPNIFERFAIQTVQPWQYGHGETKATQLWLRNLPPLVPTDIVSGREPRVHHASPGPDRWRERSRTFPGIAAAMAEQWGAL